MYPLMVLQAGLAGTCLDGDVFTTLVTAGLPRILIIAGIHGEHGKPGPRAHLQPADGRTELRWESVSVYAVWTDAGTGSSCNNRHVV